ncbi:MAG: NUDIX domain-containing protein [Candidatus Omnitrophica bacterium]|nr:NUDIX domain-containing protein [Candidatus Omnitrophota bacterium]
MKLWYLVMRGIFINEQKQVLMLQRSAKSRTFPLLWEFPGGKVDPEEHFMDALKREFREETGMVVEPEKVLGSAEMDFSDYQMAYLFALVSGDSQEVKITSEHEQFLWADQNILKNLQISSPHLNILPLVLSLL